MGRPLSIHAGETEMSEQRMRGRLLANREKMEQDLAHRRSRQYLSPAVYAQHRAITALMLKYLQGRVLDIGCGHMPFKDYLPANVTTYDTLELYPRSAEVTYVGDVGDMNMVPGSTYNSALCLEVLEHVPDPWAALRETARVLKPGGVLILSVPHLSRLHDEPHDYFRYTKYGLRAVLERSGFIVLHLEPKAGLFSFLGHQLSNILLSATWGVPGLRQLAWWLNRWLVTYLCYTLDRVLRANEILPIGYAVVARKQSAGQESL